MPNLTVSVSHQLSQNEALRRIKRAVAQAKKQYSEKIDQLSESWEDYVGTFIASAMKQKASGTVNVKPTDVTVEIALPFFASVFKPKIESGIRDALTRILA